LSREGAANYIGVSASLFDGMVRDGRMPRPKRINSRTVWDVREVDSAFDRLPGGSADAADDWEVEI
jgi:predicted DNA-binding transcriptional regulator AlpA